MTTKSSLTIKRPSGLVETIDTTAKFATISDSLFAQIKKATADAGKGEVMSYTSEVIWTDAEIAEMEASKAYDRMTNRITRS